MSKLPKTREEAFEILDGLLSDNERKELASCTEDGLGEYHFSLGLWIRNNWIYEHGADIMRLFDDGNDNGAFRFSMGADYDSAEIVTKYWRYLNGK